MAGRLVNSSWKFEVSNMLDTAGTMGGLTSRLSTLFQSKRCKGTMHDDKGQVSRMGGGHHAEMARPPTLTTDTQTHRQTHTLNQR